MLQKYFNLLQKKETVYLNSFLYGNNKPKNKIIFNNNVGAKYLEIKNTVSVAVNLNNTCITKINNS